MKLPEPEKTYWLYFGDPYYGKGSDIVVTRIDNDILGGVYYDYTNLSSGKSDSSACAFDMWTGWENAGYVKFKPKVDLGDISI